MANNFIQARKDLKLITSFVKGLVALDEELEKVTNIEAAIKDAEARKFHGSAVEPIQSAPVALSKRTRTRLLRYPFDTLTGRLCSHCFTCFTHCL
jgi:hypothetical protein